MSIHTSFAAHTSQEDQLEHKRRTQPLLNGCQSSLIKALAAFDLVPEEAPKLKSRPVSLAEAVSSWPEPALFVHLQGQSSTRALCVLNFQAVTALVENAVRGKVLDKPVISRSFTAVDYSLCETFIATFLCGLDEKLNENQWPSLRHLHLNGVIASRHEIEVFFDEGAWDLTEIEFKFSGTTRGAQMWLLSEASEVSNPVCSTDLTSVAADVSRGSPTSIGNSESDFWKAMPAELSVQSHTFQVPLNILQNLHVGMEIEMPDDVTKSGTLLLRDAHAQVNVLIGQEDGQRAIQILDTFPISSPSVDIGSEEAPE